MKRKPSLKRKKTKSFDPNRQYLDEALKAYLENGGKITKLEDVVEDEMDRLLSRM